MVITSETQPDGSSAQTGLSKFFHDYLERPSFFVNKGALQASYTPEIILHREEEIKQLASILAPALKGERPSNIFLYGKPGSGKTTSVKHIITQIESITTQKKLKVKIIYLNCKLKKVADTEYRLIAQLSRSFGKDIPPTGLPTEEVYRTFFSSAEIFVKLINLSSKKYIIFTLCH